MSEHEKQVAQSATWIDVLPAGHILVVGLVIILGIATIILFSGESGINICIFGDCGSHITYDITSGGGGVIDKLLPVAAAGGTVIVLTTMFGMSILPAVGVAAIAFVIVNLL
ncbi:hypothetical protein H4N54_01505 [Limnospira fusiformis KN01]|uniref:Uncharacterized protein n=3 Tax=Limnospira TaxID=2596745 RepID=A0A9P1P2L6_9CYAN|nr:MULTISPECIES: hypothetical protein [Limnospira]MDC0840355.1 hypothetical protein [Limnoraphis robusta]QJB24777.1 hypothetical protein HFV01_01910 [Limnospira fusiformis SAG 85.79]RAQ45921.1 hypothetical protein B9S53_06210 [Arthrospira sp. O9.13F]EDZ92065.1 hypothetical protein AmaxDRAFT_5159 [Limnospira maxima CS-328]MDT9197628.1 hypothetical protein [Limnospira sp. PMC 1042.18]